jgi:hypothetical protein
MLGVTVTGRAGEERRGASRAMGKGKMTLTVRWMRIRCLAARRGGGREGRERERQKGAKGQRAVCADSKKKRKLVAEGSGNLGPKILVCTQVRPGL